jgi:predicted RNase H-like nuclease (RuvC/YqgF family)
MNEYENEYGTVDFNITPAESTHPVLSKLYEQIATLTTENEKLKVENEQHKANVTSHQQRYYDVYSNFAHYKVKLENVLRTYAKDNDDMADRLVEIANEMDMVLENTKEFEIVARWKVTVTAPFGEEIELSEYDIDTYLNSVGGTDFEVDDTDISIEEI